MAAASCAMLEVQLSGTLHVLAMRGVNVDALPSAAKKPLDEVSRSDAGLHSAIAGSWESRLSWRISARGQDIARMSGTRKT